MKSLAAIIAAFMGDRSSRTNLKTLLRLMGVLAGLILVYTACFHFLMAREGREFSWVTGLYWTMTVMTTLGFGDITFHGDAGRLFSVLVLVSGVVFLLVILPFTFIEFFYSPWMKAQASARTPRVLPPDMKGHVIFTEYDPVTRALIPLLKKYGYPYVLVCNNVQEALEYYEKGVPVAIGDLDDPATYRNLRLDAAAMLIAGETDVLNTNITFTARELAESVPIVTFASSDSARDVLELAGATLVLRLEQTMGWALARRVIGNDAAAHPIGTTGGLVIAEANVAGTSLEGLVLGASEIRTRTGANVIGIWDHGKLVSVDANTRLQRHTILVLAGTEAQLKAYNAAFSRSAGDSCHVLIVGGGRVGRIASTALEAAGLKPVIIERIPGRVVDHPEAIIGDATSIEVMKAAGAREASTLIVTTHNDNENISLTIFFRRLRSNLQIISRCTHQRNVQTLHRAGADLVLSSASMGANSIFNLLRGTDHLLLAEGVIIFPSAIPKQYAGRRLADCAIRSETGCTIIAIESGGERIVNPSPEVTLPSQGRLLLIGTLEAEERFLRLFKPAEVPKSLLKRLIN
jgi:voltage-gated potassium channel